MGKYEDERVYNPILVSYSNNLNNRVPKKIKKKKKATAVTQKHTNSKPARQVNFQPLDLDLNNVNKNPKRWNATNNVTQKAKPKRVQPKMVPKGSRKGPSNVIGLSLNHVPKTFQTRKAEAMLKKGLNAKGNPLGSKLSELKKRNPPPRLRGKAVSRGTQKNGLNLNL